MQQPALAQTINQQQNERKKGKELYQYIIDREQINFQTITIEYTHRFTLTYLLLTIIFKFILIMHLQVEELTELWFKQFAPQFTFIMIFVDFWFTKNVSGRALAGLIWYFGFDPYGEQRFMYEARVNPQYVHWAYKRMFWFIQVSYALMGYVDVMTVIGIQYNIYDLAIKTLFNSIMKIVTSIANLFLFYKAYVSASQKRDKLVEELGLQFTQSLGPASFVAYF